jgi:hypothetical protein
MGVVAVGAPCSLAPRATTLRRSGPSVGNGSRAPLLRTLSELLHLAPPPSPPPPTADNPPAERQGEDVFGRTPKRNLEHPLKPGRDGCGRDVDRHIRPNRRRIFRTCTGTSCWAGRRHPDLCCQDRVDGVCRRRWGGSSRYVQAGACWARARARTAGGAGTRTLSTLRYTSHCSVFSEASGPRGSTCTAATVRAQVCRVCQPREATLLAPAELRAAVRQTPLT